MKDLIIETKICTSTEAVTGCGKEKPITDFPKTKHGRQAVCKDCVAELRRNKDKIEKQTSPEAKLHNELNRIWR